MSTEELGRTCCGSNNNCDFIFLATDMAQYSVRNIVTRHSSNCRRLLSDDLGLINGRRGAALLIFGAASSGDQQAVRVHTTDDDDDAAAIRERKDRRPPMPTSTSSQ